jgi:hypothetical protein
MWGGNCDVAKTESENDLQQMKDFVTIQNRTNLVVQGAAEITPTFRKITVGSPTQVVGCGPFR